jgi:hypothetical protein
MGAQMSNDCKGIQYVCSADGAVLFNRAVLTSTGNLVSGGTTTNVTGWSTSAVAVTDRYASSDITSTKTGATKF